MISKRPSRNRRFRRTALALGLLALLAGIVPVVLWFWGPAEYDGTLDALLPDRPVAVANARDLARMLDNLEGSRAYADMWSNIDLAALLLTDEDWREFVKNKDGPAVQAKLAVGRAFIKRCFGKEALLAIVPSHASQRPGFLALTRADIGFLDQIGRLAAEYYPNLSLTTEQYRGVAIYRYAADKARHCFTFILLGDVVVLSLRSPDTTYLREVVDRYHDMPATERRSDAVSPHEGDAKHAAAGLFLEAAPLTTLEAIRSLFEGKIEREFSPEQQAALRTHLRKVDRLAVSLRADSRLALEAQLDCADVGRDDMDLLFPPFAGCASAAASTPEGTAVFVAISHPDAYRAGELIWRRIREWPEKPGDEGKEKEKKESARDKTWDDALAAASDFTLKHLGADLLGPLMRPPTRHAAAALIDVQQGLLTPLPRVSLVAGATTSALAPPTTAAKPFRATTLIGPFEATTGDDAFQARLGEGVAADRAAASTGQRPSLAAADRWRALGLESAGPNAAAIVYVDFRALAKIARQIEAYSLFLELLDDDTRKDIVKTARILGALAVLDNAALTATHTGDGVHLRLVCPLQ